MKTIYDLTLARSGIFRTIPNEINFGTVAVLDLGFKNMLLVQGVDKLALPLEERNRGNIASKLLHAIFEVALLHAGVEYKG